jgi:hypothetical protein
VLLFVLSIPAIASATDQVQGKELEYEGTQGIWFSLETHRLILADVRQVPKLRERVTLLEQKLALQGANIADLQLSRDLAVQSRDVAVGAVEAAVRGRREAEESRDAWHRSRVLWFTLGFVAAAALTYGAVRIMEARRE